MYQKLSQTEQQHPETVFAALFDSIDLQSLRQCMWEGVKANVSGTFNTMPSDERFMYLEIHEHLEKVVEAIHVLHQKTQQIA